VPLSFSSPELRFPGPGGLVCGHTKPSRKKQKQKPTNTKTQNCRDNADNKDHARADPISASNRLNARNKALPGKNYRTYCNHKSKR